jgi:ATP/maltotriose-dependent transcriptional regulator MalT
MALRVAGAVWRFWYLKSHLSEGQRRLEVALRADERPTAARAKALNGLAVMALNIGDAPTAQLRAEEALALHRALGEAWGSAYSAFMVANAVAEQGDTARAKPLLAESVREFRELGDEHYALIASGNLAWVTGELGDPERERALHEDNLRRARELSDVRTEANSLAQLAMFARDDGQLEEAGSMLRAALRIDHDLGDVLGVAVNLGRLASVLALAGRAGTAARLLASSEALTEGLGASVPFWAADRNEKTLAIIRAELDEPALGKALEQGGKLMVDEAVALACDS